jgi:hypothetical protein
LGNGAASARRGTPAVDELNATSNTRRCTSGKSDATGYSRCSSGNGTGPNIHSEYGCSRNPGCPGKSKYQRPAEHDWTADSDYYEGCRRRNSDYEPNHEC